LQRVTALPALPPNFQKKDKQMSRFTAYALALTAMAFLVVVILT
jgi:hypothetical protein